MLSVLIRKSVLVLLALAGGSLLAHGAAAEAPAGPSPILAGAGERSALTSWTLREDPSDRGLSLGWQRGGFQGTQVRVPNVLHPRDYTGAAGTRNYEGSVAWYRTSFQAAQTGVYALSFQSANFLAEVWVDGHMLGSHRGSYVPFEMRQRLAAGTHNVVVRVDWRDPAAQSRQGFHRTWFNWGGIDGVVELRPIGESELSEPGLQTTLTAGGQVQVRVSVQVRNDGPARTLTPQGSLSRGAQAIPLEFGGLTLAHGQSLLATASVTVPSPALWSPSAPNLYQLDLAVGQSSYSARVGLREISWHGGRVYLNGTRLLLHGATIQEDAQGHGDALTPGDDNAIVAELKAIGANAARAQHPLDPALLERLDAAGIVVWQGIGPVEGAGQWYSSTPKLLGEAERQARTAVAAEQLHPSVIAWNLVDEVAGNGRDSAEVRYVQDLTRWLHARDPGRMVAVDVWGDHPPTQPGPLFAGVDAIAETDYSGWYDSPLDSPAQLAALMRSRLARMERTFAGRVLLISEFGAESNTLNPESAPGSYAYQARLLAAHISVYEADPRLSGMLIWVLRDYPLTPTFEGGSIHAKLPAVRLIEGINQKGLFTYAGAAKPAVSVVARLFEALPAD
ncbi:MAG TPA: glycoside hydrolase family 2 TIM barrel-domain containing protein [Solirubrobacteraceae bacterium]|nr:glycoside hydrolase family 2 TIM barrel-domain containing protein [Solirubrobacteraceae bacterium]